MNKPKVEKTLVDIKNGTTVEQSKLREYCEKKYGKVKQITDVEYAGVTWVALMGGRVLAFVEVKHYIYSPERVNKIEQRLGV